MDQPGNGLPHESRMPGPDLVEVERALSGSSRLRLAVVTLQNDLPADLEADSVRQTLAELRDRIDERELREIRDYGPRQYLLIKPFAPDADGTFTGKAAQHVRALYDLGLIVRLGL
jgi:hypothetical protein